MPWMLLFRLIISTIGVDTKALATIKALQKNSKIFDMLIKNPGAFGTNAFRSLFGKNKSLSELKKFQSTLSQALNLTKIKKQIIGHVNNKAITNLRNVQEKYKFNILEKNKGNDNQQIDNDSIIGVFVSLSSTALLGGIWVPILGQISGVYGIASLTYISNPSKSYDYPNVSQTTWQHMCEANGGIGTGANSVFNREFLNNYFYPNKQQRVAHAWDRFERKSKSKSTVGIVNKNKLMKGYSKYGKL